MTEMLWSVRRDNHLWIFWRGQPIYKNYDAHSSPSILFNKHWPNERILGKVLEYPRRPV